MKKFFEFKQMSEEKTELKIYGDITSCAWYEDEVSAFDFSKELDSIDTNLLVRINSYGGEVDQGIAIYNLLKDYGKTHEVITMCDGFACSAASVIFMAGTKRIMPKSSLLLIHNAWSYGCGDSNQLRKQADDLEKITMPSIEIYKSVSNLSEENIKSMMDIETWITADEALSYEFATEIKEIDAKQSLEEQHMFNLVIKYKNLEQQVTKITERENVDALTSFFNGGK